MGRGPEISERFSSSAESASFGVVGEAVFGADEADPGEFEAARRAAAQSRKHLRVEVALLRQRLADLRRHAAAAAQASRNAVRAEIGWIDDNAHAQLGQYPWLKLAGAMAATFVTGRMLRQVWLSGIAATAMARIASRRRRR
jgi:FAD/FMN-containing dehydrogenase